MLGSHLADDKQLLPCYTARPHAPADALLVAVGLRGVDVALAEGDRRFHGVGGAVVVDAPCPEAERGKADVS